MSDSEEVPYPVPEEIQIDALRFKPKTILGRRAAEKIADVVEHGRAMELGARAVLGIGDNPPAIALFYDGTSSVIVNPDNPLKADKLKEIDQQISEHGSIGEIIIPGRQNF